MMRANANIMNFSRIKMLSLAITNGLIYLDLLCINGSGMFILI